MKRLLYFILIFIFLYEFDGHTQTFSSDIVIDSIQPYQVGKTLPQIDINSIGEVGISWVTGFPTYTEVYYLKSYNTGQLFDTLRIVDHLNLYSFRFNSNSLKFDYMNNPVVCYSYLDDWGGTSEQYIRKSLDGGLSFILNPVRFHIIDFYLNFEFVNDTVGFLSYTARNPLGDILLKKTFDGGLTFSDSSIVQTAGVGFSPYNISTVQCNNGDILCFWTGQNDSTYRGEIYYSRSVDLGVTFSDPISLDSTYDNSNGIFASVYNNNVFIVYFAANDNSDGHILFKKSDDYGYSYHQPKILHDYSPWGLGSHPSPEIRINPNVGIGIVWGQEDIFFTYSTDFGETFSSTVNLHTYGNAKYRDYQSMAISDSGYVYIVSLMDTPWDPNNSIVLNKSTLPVLNTIKPSSSLKISDYLLYQNFPNPFNSITTILFNLPYRKYTELKIYDITGRLVNNIILGNLIEGDHRITWDGKNSDGYEVPSGIYFYQLKTEDHSETNKLLFIK